MAIVDVVMPVYNTPMRYVREALESVRCQTVRDWRVVVVNDGSNPACSSELERLISGLGDDRIAYVKTANQGVAAARNTGIDEGTAPYVAFLDADDAWYPDKLERQLALLQARPELTLVYATYDLVEGDGEKGVRKVPAVDRGLNPLEPPQRLERMLRSNDVGLSTAVVRRDALASAGRFDPQFASLEDKELWVRLLLRGARFHHMAQSLSVYRLHPANASKGTEKMKAGRLQLISKVDSLAAEGPVWLRDMWPRVRREMLRRVHVEVMETLIEAGDYRHALQAGAPWRVGVSGHTLKLSAAALLGLLRRRRAVPAARA